MISVARSGLRLQPQASAFAGFAVADVSADEYDLWNAYVIDPGMKQRIVMPR